MIGVGGWDSDVLRWAEAHYVAWIVQALDLLLRLSVVVALAATMVIGALCLARRRWRAALFWTLAVGGVLGFDLPLKDLFERPALGGPPGAYSFPSGNAMLCAALLTAAALSLSRHRRHVYAIGIPFTAAYGVALVYAWWHYPSDVAGGWCIAAAWVALLWIGVRPAHVPPRASRALEHARR